MSKPANDDVAEYVFHIAEHKICLTYHREVSKISASTREFIKPAASEDKGTTIIWNVENHSTFQVRSWLCDFVRKCVLMDILVFVRWLSMNEWMNEFYNLYPARETQGSSPGVYSPAVSGV